jgi:hypothetical protein
MTVPAAAVSITDVTPQRAPAGELLALASGEDFARWERQLIATRNCANPILLRGRVDAVDRTTGEIASLYDTDSEPGGVLRLPCGSRREDICPPCSQVYKSDARQIIRSGLTGGKAIPDSVGTHPCVFATLTAPGFGPVHTTRTSRHGRKLACRPRRDAHHRRCPHGRDLSCPRHHHEDDLQRGTPQCPDCYDYTGHVLFNALAPELWRRFVIYLPRQLARLTGITSTSWPRRSGSGSSRSPNISTAASSTTTPLSGSTPKTTATSHRCRATPPSSWNRPSAPLRPRSGTDTAALTGDDPSLRRILQLGPQTDVRTIHDATGLPATGTALPARTVTNYIAKYATKTTTAPGLPSRPVRSATDITALACSQHYKQLAGTAWTLGKHPAAAALALNRWTQTLDYRGHRIPGCS